jgi:cephalosporin hydroxylase
MPTPITPDQAQGIASAFNEIYWNFSDRTWLNTRWMGVETQKYPTDLFIYQEIIHETRPTLILETGTNRGGSALFMAQLGELLAGSSGSSGGGIDIISIDITNAQRAATLPKHPRITYLSGSSVNSPAFEKLRTMVKPDARVMVVLDSDHSAQHVAAELDAYAPMVSPGCYLIVEDTNVNGHPVYPQHGPGPWEALDRFLPAHPEFQIDHSRERFMLTANPRGYLRRK